MARQEEAVQVEAVQGDVRQEEAWRFLYILKRPVPYLPGCLHWGLSFITAPQVEQYRAQELQL